VSSAAFVDLGHFTHPPEVVVRRLARDAAGTLVGWAQVEWREGEPGASIAELYVARDHRRAGVGTALLAELATVARSSGRIGITVQAVEGSAAGKVLERAGFRADMVVEQNRTDPRSVSEALLRRWADQGEAAVGYSLVAYDAPCPVELAEGFIDARHHMNDAPRFEGEPEASFTVPELRAAEEAIAAARMDWWCVGVRHDTTGELVGLSELYLHPGRPWLVFQGDTGVAPAHRGHGLGAWMKAVNHLRLNAERPEVEIVQTWNAAANAPMLRINRELGFQPVQRYQAWYLPFDAGVA
jgi:GNAT superfamily N-acetyltransferase